MRRLALALLVVVLGVSAGFSQQPASAKNNSDNASSVVPKEEQATKEDVLALMDVMHARRNAQAGMEMGADTMRRSVKIGFLQEHPNASPELLKRFDAVFSGAMNVVSVDELIQAMVPVYQRYLSHEDAVTLISFYSTPTGQRYLDRMPALLKDVGDVSAKLVQAHIKEIRVATEKGMNDLNRYIVDHPNQ